MPSRSRSLRTAAVVVVGALLPFVPAAGHAGASPPGYQVVENDVSLPAGGFVRATADCPAGTVVFGGGALVVGNGTANFGTELQESGPGTVGGSTSVWLVAVSNHSSSNYTLGIFAVCGDAPAGYQVVENDQSLPAGGFLRTTADCPAGTVVLGGGGLVVHNGTGNFGTELQESTPGTTGGQSVWLVSATNNSTSAYTFGLFAVCGNAPAGYQVVERVKTLKAGHFVRATAKCPAHTVVLAGGAQVVGNGSADFNTELQESGPGTAGRRSVWLVAASNHSANKYSFGLFAVCSS